MSKLLPQHHNPRIGGSSPSSAAKIYQQYQYIEAVTYFVVVVEFLVASILQGARSSLSPAVQNFENTIRDFAKKHERTIALASSINSLAPHRLSSIG